MLEDDTARSLAGASGENRPALVEDGDSVGDRSHQLEILLDQDKAAAGLLALRDQRSHMLDVFTLHWRPECALASVREAGRMM